MSECDHLLIYNYSPYLKKKKIVWFSTQNTAATAILPLQERRIFMRTQFSFEVRFIRKEDKRSSHPSDWSGLQERKEPHPLLLWQEELRVNPNLLP